MVLILDNIQELLTATAFYSYDLPTALTDAQKHIEKNGGVLATTPILTQGRVMAPLYDEIHIHWYTALTENFGTTDKEGKFGERGEPVAVTVHGAVILSTQERIMQACEQGLDNYAKKITPEEGQAVLHGDFEGDHDILTFDQFKETTADKRFWYKNLGKKNHCRQTISRSTKTKIRIPTNQRQRQ